MSIVATRLVQALAESGIDQSMLARRLGVTQGTISKIARGKTINSRHLPRIAAELDVALEWLIGGDRDSGEGATMSAQDREWLALLHRLPPRFRVAVIQLSRTMAEADGADA